MTTFTIDHHNQIMAYLSAEHASGNAQAEQFTSAKQLGKLTEKWTPTRLVELCNSLPGQKPVNNFLRVADDSPRKHTFREPDISGGVLRKLGVQSGLTDHPDGQQEHTTNKSRCQAGANGERRIRVLSPIVNFSAARLAQ